MTVSAASAAVRWRGRRIGDLEQPAADGDVVGRVGHGLTTDLPDNLLDGGVPTSMMTPATWCVYDIAVDGRKRGDRKLLALRQQRKRGDDALVDVAVEQQVPGG